MRLKVIDAFVEEGLDGDKALVLRRSLLEKQGYKVVGNHSAIKLCHWCKSSLNEKSSCYKNTFYGISSEQCIQASVTLDVCNLRCQWCWRDIDYNPKKVKFNDDPKDILDGFIEMQKKLLVGFKGNSNINQRKLEDSFKPEHVALSLTGDACMYSKLPELIDEINSRGMTSFLVTNGTFDKMVEKLINHQPTQMYITLPAPDEKTFEEICKPLSSNSWKRIMKSIGLLKYFDRSVVRLTVGKRWNFKDSKKYAKIFNENDFDFLEIKSAVPIGGAMYRMDQNQVCSREEIRGFSEEISKLTGMSIVGEHELSRVVLLSKKDKSKIFLVPG